MRTDVSHLPTADAGSRSRGWDAVVLALSAAAAGLAVVTFSGVLFYAAGSRNASQFEPVVLRVAAGVGGVAVLVVLWVRVGAARPARRGRGGGPSLAVAVAASGAWPVLLFAGPSADAAYEVGFARWAAGHVDAAAVRAWLATVPPVPDHLPGSAVPANAVRDQPGSVVAFPSEVVLMWGDGTPWHPVREVLVTRAPNGPPSGDLPAVSRRASPGMYVHVD